MIASQLSGELKKKDSIGNWLRWLAI